MEIEPTAASEYGFSAQGFPSLGINQVTSLCHRLSGGGQDRRHETAENGLFSMLN
jgi:hypothetical protein